RPIRLSVKMFDPKSIIRTALPIIWWIPRHWPAGRHLCRFSAQRITIVEMRAEIEAGFKCMDDSYEIPVGYGQFLRGALILRLLLFERFHMLLDLALPFWLDRAFCEQVAVFCLQILEG